jgi:hypothetical protein
MFTSRHNPLGTTPHLNNGRLEAAISRYQAGDAESLGEIVQLVEPRVLTLIRFHKTHHYRPEDELLSDVNFKLMRSIGRFDARRATGFAYVSRIIDSSLKTAVSNQRRHWARYTELANMLPARPDDGERMDDLVFKVKSQVRTTLTDETELNAQRWLVESFCQEGFAARRHTCADVCMGAFRLSHARSRELYDLTMLEVRRVLYDSVKQREQIVAGRLLGTRGAWMTQYSPLLSAAEFSRFVVLMRNLAPYLLLLIIDPAKSNNHRRDRNPTIGRQTLELILYGHPNAKPLFEPPPGG